MCMVAMASMEKSIKVYVIKKSKLYGRMSPYNYLQHYSNKIPLSETLLMESRETKNKKVADLRQKAKSTHRSQKKLKKH